MDRQTLSNYGWIVICVLVLAVLLALSTPFGEYIRDGIWSATEGLFDVQESALGVLGIEGTKEDEQIEITDAVGSMDSNHSITLNSTLPSDTYTLKYESESGVLTEYADICTLAQGATYDDFIIQNTAPQTATRIGVYSSKGDRVGSIGFAPTFKVNLGNKLYSFGALSDAHIGYATSEDDLKNALTYLTQTEKVDFIINTGDLTSEITDSQISTYKNIVNDYSKGITVYEITGNHEGSDYSKREDSLSVFENYTGDSLYYSFTKGNDVFIALGIDGTEGDDYGNILAEGELQWLYETLEANKDKRCFVFTHSYLNDSSGSPSGFGTDSIWLGTEDVVFKSLLKHYPNISLFHGHSHTSLTLQSLSDKANIDNSIGFNSIHVPSLTIPRFESGEGNLDESEGYVVNVYQNGIILKGRDFVDGKFLPIAQYYVSTVSKNIDTPYVDDNGIINSEKINFQWNHNCRLDSSTGAEQVNSEYSASEHIELEVGKTHWVGVDYNNGWDMSVYFYDENGNFINRVRVWGGGTSFSVPVKLSPPTNAKSFRFRIYTGGTEQAIKLATSHVYVTKR